MLRQHPLLFFISILFLATLACNAFAGEAEPTLSVPPPIVTLENGTAVPGQATVISGIAPTATLPGGSSGDATAVASSDPYITILVDLNIRSGPGVAYDRLGFFLKDSTAQVLGQDPASGWWLVACPSDIAAPQCWVSGGSQYSLGTNVGSVPVAAAPPTPTPVPTTAPTDSDADTAVLGSLSYIIYSDTDGIWQLPLDTTQSPPTSGDPVLLAAVANIENLLISPNGQQIAYVAGTFESNRLGIVSVAGDSQTLVESSDLPNSAGTDFGVLINQIEWLPNSQTIAFNTRIVNLVGPGAAPQPDLWLVTTSGSLTEQFPLNSGGHTFALSPDGTRVIFGNPESVTRVNMDGSNRETVIEFPFVNTASEYAWVPTAQWLPSGSQAYVAIATADPWTEAAAATLYQIPVSGPATEMGTVPGNTLFSPLHWTNNGGRLAYLQIIINSDNLRTVALANGDGSDLVPYVTTNNQLEFTGWNKAGAHFLYYGAGFIGIGQQDQTPVEILISGGVGQQMWLTDSVFVTAVGSSGNWTLFTGNVSGNLRNVGDTAVEFVNFDVWTP